MSAEITSEHEQIHELGHALEEAQRMILMQGVTINALQSRLWHVEMELVDQMSASMAATQVSEPSVMESPE